MNEKINVLLIEDEHIVREAMAALLKMESSINVVGVAANAASGLRETYALHPDVVLLDMHLPDQSCSEIIARLLEAEPNLRVVVVTGSASDEEIATALRSGAVGCVFKTQPQRDLVQAIEYAHQGGACVPPQIAKYILQSLNPPKSTTVNKLDRLSKAEQHILTYVAKGLDNKEIARHLCISRPTVHTHISNILDKLQLENRTQAAVFAVKHGLVSLTPHRQPAPRNLSLQRPSITGAYAGD
jgi:DNA-binding NarL/FixJ family response regulator